MKHLFYVILYLLQTRPPQNDQIQTPPAFPNGHASSPIPPSLRPRLFGWLLHAVVDWRPPKPTTNFMIYIYLSLNLMDKTMGQRPPPSLLPCAPSHPMYIPTIRSLFGWLLRTPIQQKPLKSEAPSPSLFSHFSLLYPSPKRMSKPPPPRVTLVRISSPTLPPPPTPSFGWLLHQTIKQRPSKTGVLPVSQFFDWGHYSDQ